MAISTTARGKQIRHTGLVSDEEQQHQPLNSHLPACASLTPGSPRNPLTMISSAGIIVEDGVQRRVEHKHGVLIHESEVPNAVSQHAAQSTRSPNGGGGSSYPQFQPTSGEVAHPAQGNSPVKSSGARDGWKKQSKSANEDDWLGGLFSFINCTPCCTDMTAMSIQEHQTTVMQTKEKPRGGAGTESIV
jgi:hypothetical protein